MRLVSPAVWFVKHSVMVFSIGYVVMSIVTAVHIIALKQSYCVAFFAVYCYSQVCLNWRALFYFSSKDHGMEAVESLDNHPYSYCPDCNIFKQKLSHHCPLCQHCVLRHDHHCFFLGTCIGLENQGYFIILCLYTGLGSLYLAVHIFLFSDWTFDYWYNYLELFMPFGFVFSLLRAPSLTSAFLVIVYNLSTVVGVFCTYMFILQVLLLSRSLTWHEFNTKARPIKGCQPAMWHNFKSNFARFKLISFVIPVIPVNFCQNNSDLSKEMV